MASPLFRRSFLRGFVVVAAAQLGACGDDTDDPNEPEPSTDPEDQDRVYPQGIASGDPTPSSVIFWVRVEPEDEEGEIRVEYQIATDESFSDLVVFDNTTVDASTDYTLRLKVTDLSPHTTYYYRFTSRDVRSPVGRTKTAPTSADDVDVRFAMASCQDFIGRYYHSWAALAEEPDVDFVLFLGDYIYETNGDPDFQTTDPDRAITIPDGISLEEDNPDVKAAATLADYRGIYKQYRRDKNLQAIHARYPFIIIWDDHEFANDSWQDHSTDFNDAEGDEKNPGRRHAASQAWFEFQPADIEFDLNATPPADIKIYRTLRYGKNVELILTDQRSYRDDHVIPEGGSQEDRPEGAPDTVPTYAEAGKQDIFPNSEIFTRNFVRKPGFDLIEAYVQPTMLGAEQKAWLIDAITTSSATWKLWGNQTQLVQMALDLTSFDIPESFKAVYYFTADQWDGYRSERREILEAIAGERNVVALTGDIHAFYAAEIHVDPDVLDDEPVMVEYVTAGISSSPAQEITANVVAGNPLFEALADLVPQFDDILTTTSLEYKYAKSQSHGVTIVEVSPEELVVEFLQIRDVKTKEWNGNVDRVKFRTVAGSARVEPL